MKRLSFLIVYIFFVYSVVAQDAFHQELIRVLNEENNIGTPEFLLFDTEAAIIDNLFVYGDVQRTISESTDNAFAASMVLNYDVRSAGDNQWDAGTGISNKSIVEIDDIILISFWGKQNSDGGSLFIFAENSSTFDKQIYFELILTPDWTQYFIAFKSTANFNADELNMGFHLAGIVQNFDLAGFTALNYNQNAPIEAFPSTFAPDAYGGHEPDAPWRAEAAERIEQLRKSSLTITVVDASGDPLENANVRVEMQEHAFGFGSALVGCRFPGNRCFDATYVEKLTDLDGQGHGFNVSVMENALKWDGWEEEWIGTPEQTISAVQWLADNGIEMRGHTMFWPGFNMLPDDILQNQSDLPYIRTRIDERINRMLTDPTLSTLITEWDVLNEITVNRDFERIFDNDPNFDSGREIYPEIFGKIKNVDTSSIIYVNDYVTLSGGGSGPSVTNRYKSFLQEMYDSEVPFEGIGFQCHIGSSPTSILKVESTLNEFYEQFPVPFKITEYDIDINVDEETQANYMNDFLTMIFSHPAVEAFIMWGFWDGNHWKGNAPIFREDWSIKPSGEAFIDKVFNEWWTDESITSDVNGNSTISAFKGRHKIIVEKDGQRVEQEIEIKEDVEIEIMLDLSTNTNDIRALEFRIVPNPAEDRTTIMLPQDVMESRVRIFNLMGGLVFDQSISSNAELSLKHLASGTYLIKFDDTKGVITKKFIIK